MKPEKQAIEIKNHTPFSELPVDPEKTKLPVILHGDRVIVKKVEADNKHFEADGKAFLKVHNAEEPYSMGEIFSIGPGYPDFKTDHLTLGSFVNYYHQRAMDVEVNGEKFHMVRAGDCFMTI